MTDDELRERIKVWRVAAYEVGSMHGYWEVIFDAEAILKGEQSIMNRAQVEKALAKEPDLSAHYAAQLSYAESKRGKQ